MRNEAQEILNILIRTLSCLNEVFTDEGPLSVLPLLLIAFCAFLLSIVHSSVLSQRERSCRCFVFLLLSLPGGCVCAVF